VLQVTTPTAIGEENVSRILWLLVLFSPHTEATIPAFESKEACENAAANLTSGSLDIRWRCVSYDAANEWSEALE
jgi:hypothetical protein